MWIARPCSSKMNKWNSKTSRRASLKRFYSLCSITHHGREFFKLEKVISRLLILGFFFLAFTAFNFSNHRVIISSCVPRILLSVAHSRIFLCTAAADDSHSVWQPEKRWKWERRKASISMYLYDCCLIVFPRREGKQYQRFMCCDKKDRIETWKSLLCFHLFQLPLFVSLFCSQIQIRIFLGQQSRFQPSERTIILYGVEKNVRQATGSATSINSSSTMATYDIKDSTIV